jgi:thiopeptide-type bacteriocin biosynthesis protein
MTLEWLFLVIRPGADEDLDPLVTDVVGPLADLARDDRESVLRWFFLRYQDQTGPHVRLRLLCPLRLAEHFEQLAAVYSSGLPRPALALYEPEWEKYGSADGVAHAERVFESSSILALELVREGLATQRRRAIALALMEASASIFLPCDRRREFWLTHAEAWRRLSRESAPDWTAPAGAEAEGVCDRPAVAQYIAELEVTRQMIQAGGLTGSAVHWLFHLVHLTNNRVGVSPPEESALAREAAARAELVESGGTGVPVDRINQPAGGRTDRSQR